MSSENLHAPRERLSQETLNLHFAIVSLMEELDAIDWYRQRADDAEDETLKQLLLHNMREEMEHASICSNGSGGATATSNGFSRHTFLRKVRSCRRKKPQPPRASAGEGRKTYEEARRQASRSAR
jgi:hypothetical protein